MSRLRSRSHLEICVFWTRRTALALTVGTLAVAATAANGTDASRVFAAMVEQTTTFQGMGWALLLLYAFLLALPFVPSAEVGLAIMLALGSSMAVPVYAATVLGLTIAFIAGRHAHLYRRGHGVGDTLRTPDGIALLRERFRNWPTLQHLLRFRGLAFIVMINMPGNTVVGGGGGIAMAVGYSRSLTFRQFLVCVTVAVAPVPAFFVAADLIGLESSVRDWLDHILATMA